MGTPSRKFRGENPTFLGTVMGEFAIVMGATPKIVGLKSLQGKIPFEMDDLINLRWATRHDETEMPIRGHVFFFFIELLQTRDINGITQQENPRAFNGGF